MAVLDRYSDYFKTSDHQFGFKKPLGCYGMVMSLIFTARRSYASAVLGVVILSVCPSVCHTRAF